MSRPYAVAWAFLSVTPIWAQAPSSEDELAQVVVSAQRRQEDMQSVPISILALSSDQVRQLGVGTTLDLPAAVPGLTILPTGGSFNPVLRGIGSENGAVGDEGNVAIYVDGVYVQTHQGGFFSLGDVDHIEVLKGPQGTLFGRNAAGGVIQIITKTPSHDRSADVTVGYGNYNTVDASGYATGGLTDTLAANLAFAYHNQGEGFGTNFGTGHSIWTHRSINLRTKWLWDLPVLRVTLAADWDEERNQDNQDRLLPGATFGVNGSTYYYGFQNVNLDFDPRLHTRQSGVSVQLEHEFSAARLLSITSFRDLLQNDFEDGDGTPINFQTIWFSAAERSVTEELQLQSAPQSRVTWILGAFLLGDRAQYPSFRLQQPPETLALHSLQDSRSYAVFGQATMPVLPRTNLTLGARYTIDERKVDGGVALGVEPILPLGPLYSAAARRTFSEPTWRIAVDHRLSDDILAYVSYNRGFKSGLYNLLPVSVVPKSVDPETVDAYEIGLKVDLLANRLRLNVAGYVNEFRNIQIQIPQGTSIILQNATRAQIKGLELDLTALAASHLTVQAGVSLIDSSYKDFRGAAKNFPCPAVIPITGPASACLVPGGGNYGPPPNAASLPEYDASGEPLDLTPKAAATVSATYTIHVSSGRFEVGPSISYNSGFYWGPDDRLRQPNRTLINGAVTWQSSDDLWTARLWGKNLTGAHYYLLENDRPNGDYVRPAAPLTFGLSLSRRFE